MQPLDQARVPSMMPQWHQGPSDRNKWLPSPPLAPTQGVRLPRNVPCIELADLRAAYAPCAATQRKLRVVQCTRSVEKTCAKRAAHIAEMPAHRCPVGAQSIGPAKSVINQELSADARRGAITWRSVVIGMALHASSAERELLQAAADTWLQMTPGADLLLMTDADDLRPDHEVAPLTTGLGAVVVYRCAGCRGLRCVGAGGMKAACTGVKEGWLARRKVCKEVGPQARPPCSPYRACPPHPPQVLHLLVAMARRYAATSSDGYRRKQLFIKVDPDTLPLPTNMLKLLVELHTYLGFGQPFFFGMAACRVTSFALCHAAGGAGYGLSWPALVALETYVMAQYPSFLRRVDRFSYGGEDVTVAFALKKQAGVSVINCGCMYQHQPETYRHLHAHGENWVRWPLSTTPVSFHKFKDAKALRRYFACALYDESGRPRPTPRSLFMLDPNQTAGTEGLCHRAWWPATPSEAADQSGRSREAANLTWIALPEE